MATIKIGDSHVSIVFSSGRYIDKLSARNIILDESIASSTILNIDLAHYSKRKRKNLEDSDFALLQSLSSTIVKLNINDDTVATSLAKFPIPISVKIEIGASSPLIFGVLKHQYDSHTASFEF